MKFFILSLLAISISSCVFDDADNKLLRVNKTNQAFYLITCNDTDLNNYPNPTDFDGNLLDSLTKRTKLVMNTTWENYILEGKSKRLEVFLIEAKKAETLSKQELLKSKSNYQHFSFTIGELNKCNWTIVIDTGNGTEYVVRPVKASDTVGVKYGDYMDGPRPTYR